MPPPNISLIHRSFLGSLKSIEARFNRVRRSVSGKRKRRVHGWLAEMSLVSAVTAWEHYLEELLVAYLAGKPESFRMAMDLSKNTPITRALVKAVISGTRYLTIGRYENIRTLATRLIGRNHVFQVIKSQGDQRIVDNPSVIRNLIVHESTQSRRAYHVVLEREGFKGRKPQPAGYLLARKGTITRLQSILRDYTRAARKLRAAS